MSITVIKDQDHFIENVTKNEVVPDLVLAYFTASWCGPCKHISPVVSNIAEHNSHIKVIKIDVDECEEVSESCEIECMPTFKFYKNNSIEPVDTFSGADADGLINQIEKVLNTNN